MSTTHEARMSQVALSVAGLSVGDAFGERFFGPPGVMSGRISERQLPAAPWGWTDDTAMALGIQEVLATHQRISQDELAEVFARRFHRDRHRGYGPKAQEILDLIYQGTPWEIAARTPYADGSKGNGGAMRASPVGAYFSDDLDRVVKEARASAEVTHAHPEGQQGAIAVALAAAWALRREGDLFDLVLPRLEPSETRRRVEAVAGLPASTEAWRVAAQVGAGKDVLAEDTVPFALWCAAAFVGSFEEAMWNAVSALGDRDTTCAIVGGIVALRSAVPPSWLEAREPLA